MLISEEYRELNKLLHKGGNYGIVGGRFAKTAIAVMQQYGCESILDYGCGTRTLERALGFPIRNYDPAIEEYSATPEPADLVMCTDVLEHIEPDCINDVLDDLKRVVGKIGFFTINLCPAGKKLADGRNAHILLRSTDWWLRKLLVRFKIKFVNGPTDCELSMLVARL